MAAVCSFRLVRVYYGGEEFVSCVLQKGNNACSAWEPIEWFTREESLLVYLPVYPFYKRTSSQILLINAVLCSDAIFSVWVVQLELALPSCSRSGVSRVRRAHQTGFNPLFQTLVTSNGQNRVTVCNEKNLNDEENSSVIFILLFLEYNCEGG